MFIIALASAKHALGVLCCFALFVCLTLLASFFLPSHLSNRDHVAEKGTLARTATKLSWVMDSYKADLGHGQLQS